MCSIDSARRNLSKNDVRAHVLDLKRAQTLDLTHWAVGRTNTREGGLITIWTNKRKRGAPLKVKAPTSNIKKKKLTTNPRHQLLSLRTNTESLPPLQSQSSRLAHIQLQRQNQLAPPMQSRLLQRLKLKTSEATTLTVESKRTNRNWSVQRKQNWGRCTTFRGGDSSSRRNSS